MLLVEDKSPHRIAKYAGAIKVIQDRQQTPSVPLVGHPAAVRNISRHIHKAVDRQVGECHCGWVGVEVIHKTAEELERCIQVRIPKVICDIPA